jgi:type IV secretory pathway TraG/TraD family ATPase VirD4
MNRSPISMPGFILIMGLLLLGVTIWLRSLLNDAPPGVLLGLSWAMIAAVALILADGVAVGYALSPRGWTRRRYGRGGFATIRDLWTTVTRHAFTGRRSGKCAKIRPELHRLGFWQRRQIDLTACAMLAGRTVVGPLLAFRAWIALIDVTLMIAPPQTGKTSWLAGRIVDAPGAAVVTSTKIDLWWMTHALRSVLGPVLVFNPEQVGRVASTFRWSPLVGCHDPATAAIRAEYLVSGAQTGNHNDSNAEFFVAQAAKVLRVFLFLAAVSGHTMVDVARWVNNPTDETPAKLMDSYRARVPEAWPGEMRMVYGMSADKARDSIFLTLGMSVAFMDNPAVREAVTLHAGDGEFVVENFLRCRGTLYLIGQGRDHSPLAPLLAALTGYIFEQCSDLAQRSSSPKGQLNPPIMFALDEAALITPVPLQKWGADAGGRGITVIVVAQALSQLYQRWGNYGGKTIKNLANAQLYLGGITDAADLEEISVQCGEREEDHSQGLSTGQGSRSVRRTVPPGRVRQIPPWHILMIYRNMRPTILRFVPAHKRADIKAAIAAQGAAPADYETAYAPTPGEFPRGVNPDGTPSRPHTDPVDDLGTRRSAAR